MTYYCYHVPRVHHSPEPSVQMTLFPLIRIILGAGDHPPLVFMREVEVGLAPCHFTSLDYTHSWL